MIRLERWTCLEPYGIETLTGESCGLSYRLLCDLTDGGKRIVEKALGVGITLAEPWNAGTQEKPHVGSMMIAPEMRPLLSVFALLEAGCIEAWLLCAAAVIGIERGDSATYVDDWRSKFGDGLVRTFRYGGTAGDRNIHRMSGRAE